MSTLVELDDELGDPGCEAAAPFKLTSAELEELAGDCEAPAPFRWISVELDELAPGVVFDADPLTPRSISVREEELAPGTTAAPGPKSVVVLVVADCASGTLGMQPAGCVFAGSMHFGAPDGIVTV